MPPASGPEARTRLKWNDWSSRTTGCRPDIVVLAYGTNEANATGYDMESYATDLRKVLGKLREASPNSGYLVGPLTQPKVSKGYRVWDRTALVAEVQRQVAPEFQCVFWDWQATGGEGSMVAWNNSRPQSERTICPLHRKGYVHSSSLLRHSMMP